jgi:hypothetical protein
MSLVYDIYSLLQKGEIPFAACDMMLSLDTKSKFI